MKINWKQKLSSRKFWLAVVGFVTALLITFGVEDGTVTQVASTITAGGTLIAYIVAEGYADAKRVEGSKNTESEE